MGRYRAVAVDVLLWLFAFFLVWVFARQGWAKFSDTSGWAKAFRIWHFPDWFRIVVGMMEVAAAVLLLTRRTASAGAALIMAVMLGAMATHVWWGKPGQVTSEVLPLTLSTIVAVGRRRDFLKGRRAEKVT
jgi:uncharacterized membrane protein YphA (DoxX/SURF4 family)